MAVHVAEPETFVTGTHTLVQLAVTVALWKFASRVQPAGVAPFTAMLAVVVGQRHTSICRETGVAAAAFTPVYEPVALTSHV